MELWLPNASDAPVNGSSNYVADALRAFVNTADKSLVADYLSRRFRLSRGLFKGAIPIPSPPGIEYPGILGWDQNSQSFLRVDFGDSKQGLNPVAGLEWGVEQAEAKGLWKIYRAKANGWSLLGEELSRVITESFG